MARQFQSPLSWKTLSSRRQRVGLSWAFALLFAWLLSFVMVEPVAAQTEITDSTPCLSSTKLTNLSGGGIRGITNQPVISGNGTRVSFWSVNNLGGGNVDGNIEIFVGEPGSNAFVQLTDSVGSILGGFNLEPSINTAGNRIAFYSDRDLVAGQNTDGNFEIFLASRANNGTWSITQITNTQGSANLFPSINAAGNRIAFVSDDAELHNIDQTRVNADRNFEIFLATVPNSGGAQFRQITSTGAGVTNDQPVINSTGSRIAFTAATGQTAQVFVWDESNSNPAQLTQTDNNEQPSISADGTSIVYIATSTDDRSRVVLHTLSADGSESRSEVIVPSATNTKYRSPSISGNGERVVYVAEQGSGAAIQIDVLLYDVNTGLGVPISEVGGGTGEQPAISTDGTRVAFVGVQAVGGSTDNTGSDIYINECPQSDLVLEFVTPPATTILAGVDVVYQLRVTNRGPSVATSAFFRSELGTLPNLPANVGYLLPPGCSTSANDILSCPLGNIAVNASKVFTFGYDIASNAELKDIVSKIDVVANVVDSNAADNTTGQFKTRIFEESSLSLQVSPDRTSILAGSTDQLTYDLVVSNPGPSQARSARITDTLPTGVTFVSVQVVQGGGVSPSCNPPVSRVITCQLGNLTAGSTTIVRIKVTANASALNPLTNVATVRSLTQESNLANNTVTTLTTVERSSNLAVTKVASPANSVIAGRGITYTLAVRNLGPSLATSVRLTDVLPANVFLVSATVPAGRPSCTTGATVTCNIGSLTVNQELFYTVVVTRALKGTITNTVSVSGDAPDIVLSNNRATHSILVNPDVPNRLVFTRQPSVSATAGVVFGTMPVVEIRDRFNNLIVNTTGNNDTIRLTPYRDVGTPCTNLADPNAFPNKTPQDGVGGVVNYSNLSYTKAESIRLLAEDIDRLGVTPACSTAIGVNADTVKALFFTTPPRSFIAGDISPVITVERRDQFNNLNTDSDFTVLLSETSPTTGTFLDSSTGGANTISSIVIPGGSASASFYYTDTVIGTYAITAAGPDLTVTPATQAITVNAAPAQELLVIISAPLTTTAGTTSGLFMVQRTDRFNNPNTTDPDVTVNLTTDSLSGNGVFRNIANTQTITQVTIPQGSSTTQFSYRDTLAEAHQLTVSDAAAILIGDVVTITVVPSTTHSLVITSTPQTIVAGVVSGPVRVVRQDFYGNHNFTDSTLTVNLASTSTSGTKQFRATAGGSAVSSVSIPTGSDFAQFYYRDELAGIFTLTTSAAGILPDSQAITVNADVPNHLAIITTTTVITAGAPPITITIQRQDQFNNPAPNAPPLDIFLQKQSPQGNFLAIGANTVITKVTISNTDASFRYQDFLQGNWTLTYTDNNLATNFDATQPMTVNAAVPAKLIFLQTASTVIAGIRTTIFEVQRQDQFDNPYTGLDALTVNLTSSSPGAHMFISGIDGTTQVPSVLIPAGQSTATFYYNDSRAGDHTITADDAGPLTAATTLITVLPSTASKTVIISSPLTATAGVTSTVFTVQVQDQFDNAVTPTVGSPVVINLTTDAAQPPARFVHATLNSTIISVTVAGSSTGRFRYYDEAAAVANVTVDDDPSTGTLTPDSAPITIVPAVASKVIFLTPPLSLTAGVTSTEVFIQRLDRFNNPNFSDPARQLNLTENSPSVTRFISGTNNTIVSSVTIPTNSDRISFKVYETSRGTYTITVTPIGSPNMQPIQQPYSILGAAAARLRIQGSSPQVAGTSQQLTITALDAFGNISDPYTGTKTLTFSGASNAPNGTQPTVTNAGGSPINFGSPTDIIFSAGVATVGGSMVLYDASTTTVDIAATDAGINAAGVDRLSLTVTASSLNTIVTERSAGSSETPDLVPSQNITAGSSLTLHAVGRDAYNNSRGTVSATWVMTRTGGVVYGDLSTLSGASTIFTAHLSGTAIIEARVSGAIPVASGTLSVVPAAQAVLRVETQPDGSGVLVTDQNIASSQTLTVYAVTRDSNGNFTGLRESNWTMVNNTSPNVTTANNLAPTNNSTFTVFTAKQIGSGRIRATAATGGSITSVDSGLLTVVSGPATRFDVTSASTNMTAGTPSKLTITARDAYNNTATGYTGPKTFTFSGAQPSTRPVTQPTVANSSNNAIMMGQPVALNFSAGVVVNTNFIADMTLYHVPSPSPVVVVTASDGTISGTVAVNMVAGATNKLAIDAPTSNLAAGQPVSLTLRAEDAYGNADLNYSNDENLRFSGSPDPNIAGFPATVTDEGGTQRDFGVNTSIDFNGGIGVTAGGGNGVMRLYKVGTYVISVEQNNGFFPSGSIGSKSFTVTASPSQALTLNLDAAAQTNRTAFTGSNTVTLTDIYGNAVSTRPVTITTSLPGAVIIAGSGNDNVLNSELASGTANLSAGGLAMRYEGLANAIGTFTVTTANPLGGFLTAFDTVQMNAAAPTLIRIQGATTTDAISNTLTVTAGQPISLTMRLFDQDGNLATNNTSTRSIVYTLNPNPTTAADVTDNDGGAVITINGTNAAATNFVAGVSTVASNGNNGRLRLYRVGTYTLSAAAASPALNTQSGHELVITVVPAPADQVQVSLQDGQTNNVPFTGINTVRAFDQYSNQVTSFGTNGERITLTVTSPVTGVLALPGSATGQPVLTGPDFTLGESDLTARGLRYTGLTATPVTIQARLRKANGTTADFTDSVTVQAGAVDHFVFNIPGTTVVAGNTLPATLTSYDLSGNAASFTGAQSITFTGALTATDGTAPSIEQPTALGFDQAVSINFTSGVANFNVRLVRTGTPAIFVRQGGVQKSNADSVTVTPAAVAAFVVNIAPTQVLSATFTGTNLVTANDTYSNVVTSFDASAANVQATVIASPTCATTPAIIGLGSGNNSILNRAGDFPAGTGVANLIANSNAMRLNSACAGAHRFRFSLVANGAVSGDSGSITFN